jgi:hypothetical protein
MKKIILSISAALMTSAAIATDFSEKEVLIHNDEAGITLAGTLTVPAKGDPRASLVLVTGSGQQNRDEEVMGHRPFKAIAEYLSANGFAVLRMDDRGIGGSEGNFAKSTADDFKSDTKCGVDFVRSTFLGVKVGVLGHSEGGSIAIEAGSGTSPFADFIITLAAPAWAGDSIVMSQARALAISMTGRWDQEQLQRQILDVVKSPMGNATAISVIYNMLCESVGDATSYPGVKEQLLAQAKAVLTPDYRRLIRYNPESYIKVVAVPWLALNGDKDCQVLPANLTTIAQLNPSAETRLLEGHNHLFQRCVTGLITEYATLPDDISPATLTAILTWLTPRFPTK